MFVEFTEFNTGKTVYVSHNEATTIQAIENADKGSCITIGYYEGAKKVFVQQSPYEVAKKFDAAEKTVENY